LADVTIRAIIFDRDGVLTFFDIPAAAAYLRQAPPLTPYDLLQQWETHGREYGFPTSLADEEAFFRTYWTRLFAAFKIPDAVQPVLLAMHYTDYVRAYPDAVHALASLHAAGFRLGVLSNFSLASLEESLIAAGLGQWIDAAAAATVIGAAKPAAAAYHTILQRLGVAPAEAVFFDDELPCVVGARQVGMHAFLVDRKRTVADLSAGVVANLAEVTAALTWLEVTTG
jgi:FMN phosphatase YigB (HAD superfamily)